MSPFKYIEGDCVWQYLKLEKKIAAGADYAITQVGWDSEKFRELKRYVDERGLRTPLLGNVYVLGPRAAERMARGGRPGAGSRRRSSRSCARKPGGRTAGSGPGSSGPRGRSRCCAASATPAPTSAAPTTRTMSRGSSVARASSRPAWEELAAGASLRAARRVLSLRPASGPHRDPDATVGRGPEPVPGERRLAVPTDEESGWRRGIARLLDARAVSFPSRGTRPSGERSRAWPRGRIGGGRWRAPSSGSSSAIKRPLFGCQACGNCVLGHLEYVCPETCPKHLRNGPCGGTHLGRCEVADQPCVWVGVHARARAAGRERDLLTHIPPPDRVAPGHELLDQLLPRSRPPADPHSLTARSERLAAVDLETWAPGYTGPPHTSEAEGR